MDQNKNYKIKRNRKSGIAIGLASVIMLGSFIKLAIPSKESTDTNPFSESSYTIAVETTDEYNTYDYSSVYIPIALSSGDVNSFNNYLQIQTPTYTIAKYYCIDETLEHYRNTTVKKGNNTDILNSSGKIDANKLYDVVMKNNDKYMDNGKNSINIFYKDLDSKNTHKICDLIAEVVNESCTEEQRKNVADTLSELKIYQRTSGVSNAYISNEITFVYNPSMSSSYSNIQQIRDGSLDKEEVINSVLVHEVEHLIQYLSNDRNNENGIELGFCRMYNAPSMDKKVTVDSLYYSWLLEGSAELNMSKYLNMEPGTYAKNISCIDTFNLSRILITDTEDEYIENLASTTNIDEVFEKLHITDEQDKVEFMKQMYSIELTQESNDDFWEYYQEKTNQDLSEDEITALKMDVREDVIINLSQIYYENLITAVEEGTIDDLNTLFFMMRVWEIDAYSHLEYSKDSLSLEHATRYLNWNNDVQNEMFRVVASSNNLEEDQVKEMYEEYNLYVYDGENASLNCNLDNFKENQKEFILEKVTSYNTNGFSKTSAMVSYLKESSTTYQ